MPENGIGLEVIGHRNKFYYDNYRQMMIVVLMLFVIIIELSIFITIQQINDPIPLYFPCFPDGKPIETPPLNIAYFSDETVVKWVTAAIEDTYSLDFANYKKSLEEARQYFTPKGHKDFIDGLINSANIEAVKAKSFIVSSKISGAPSPIDKTNNYAGARFAWRFTIPLLVTLQNSRLNVITQKLEANVVVVRTSTLEHLSGLAIEQLILSERF